MSHNTDSGALANCARKAGGGVGGGMGGVGGGSRTTLSSIPIRKNKWGGGGGTKVIKNTN